MKITVVSNCQGESVNACLNEMNVEINSEFVIISDLWSGARDLNQIFRDSDVVFAQSMIAEHVSPSNSAKVRYFPNITFPAFHPDITYVRGKKHSDDFETIHTHMAHYNSALIVYGYVRGFTNNQIIELFNRENFKKLGYLDRLQISREMLLNEGEKIGFPLHGLLEKWEKTGCFMHSFNHPSIMVAADLAGHLLKGLGINAQNKNPSRYLRDPLKEMPVWPIYPEIGSRYGLEGDYAFTQYSPLGTMQLRQYVESCTEHYKSYQISTIEPLNFSLEDYDVALKLKSRPVALKQEQSKSNQKPEDNKSSSTNPYRNIPDVQFWKKSVAEVPLSDVDPVGSTRFSIDKADRVATAGSCFAQHIARTLSKSGFNYFVTETAPENVSTDEASLRNYGVFSARYGNIYTARQFAQLFQRVDRKFNPVDNYWLRKDGRIVDPFRPQIEPEGFASLADLEASRNEHFNAIIQMFRETDVFVFTLGLTEGWRSKIDGAVFPLAPGVAGGEMDFDKYEFVNFTISEVISDMQTALVYLREMNPKCKVILTVSPVPLIATYEPQHALVATTYSKSVLRVAADEIRRSYDFVDYFPSFEIITGSYNRGAYFEDDLRSVKPEGVSHVMKLFMRHYTDHANPEHSENEFIPTMKNTFDVVCDEEAIAKL